MSHFPPLSSSTSGSQEAHRATLEVCCSGELLEKNGYFPLDFPLGLYYSSTGLIRASKSQINTLRQIRWILSLLFMAGMFDGVLWTNLVCN